VLDLVEHSEFARPLVNSGRLSLPCSYDGSSLNGVDALPNGPARSRPGSPCSDAPLGADPSAIYLIRPDQHVAACWREPDAEAIASALRRAIGKV